MNASITDLRYRMHDVLKALDRHEAVRILHHGKVKGVIRSERTPVKMKVRDHPFFGMDSGTGSVEDEMATLRDSRHIPHSFRSQRTRHSESSIEKPVSRPEP